MRRSASLDRVGAVVDYLHELVLTAPKAELTHSAQEAPGIAAVIKRLVASGSETKARSSGKSANAADLAARIQVLRRLAAGKPGASPRVALMFRASRKPTREQIDRMISELQRARVSKKAKR
jgi:hypothetical protein